MIRHTLSEKTSLFKFEMYDKRFLPMYLKNGEKEKRHLLCQELNIRSLTKASEVGLIVPTSQVRSLMMPRKGATSLKS